MAFTVHMANESHPFRDEDVYTTPSSGKLVVQPANGTTVFIYNHWTYLETDNDHGPGKVKGAERGNRTAFAG